MQQSRLNSICGICKKELNPDYVYDRMDNKVCRICYDHERLSKKDHSYAYTFTAQSDEEALEMAKDFLNEHKSTFRTKNIVQKHLATNSYTGCLISKNHVFSLYEGYCQVGEVFV